MPPKRSVALQPLRRRAPLLLHRLEVASVQLPNLRAQGVEGGRGRKQEGMGVNGVRERVGGGSEREREREGGWGERGPTIACVKVCARGCCGFFCRVPA
jgi:hypothetical protein